jgi:membrane protease YdiL (CAAX protease family)
LDQKSYPWKIFWILYGAALVGILAVMPFLLVLFRKLPLDKPLPFSLPVLLVLQFVQSAVLLAIATGAGLWLAGKLGKGTPLLHAWLNGEKVGARARELLRVAVPAGACVGALLLVLLRFVFVPLEPALRIVHMSDVAVWKKFLASFYGGIVEELFMRLFLLSLLVWLLLKLARLARAAVASPGAKLFWAANILIAILFGLGHLSSAALMLPLTATVIIAALVLNGIASLAFGYLYWTRGLESAMVAHFTADIILHVVGTLLFGG